MHSPKKVNAPRVIDPRHLSEAEMFELRILKRQIKRRYPSLTDPIKLDCYAFVMWIFHKKHTLAHPDRVDGIMFSLDDLDPNIH